MIFVSYCRTSGEITEKIADLLRQRDFDVWLDLSLPSYRAHPPQETSASISALSNVPRAMLARAVSECRAVVFVIAAGFGRDVDLFPLGIAAHRIATNMGFDGFPNDVIDVDCNECAENKCTQRIGLVGQNVIGEKICHCAVQVQRRFSWPRPCLSMTEIWPLVGALGIRKLIERQSTCSHDSFSVESKLSELPATNNSFRLPSVGRPLFRFLGARQMPTHKFASATSAGGRAGKGVERVRLPSRVDAGAKQFSRSSDQPKSSGAAQSPRSIDSKIVETLQSPNAPETFRGRGEGIALARVNDPLGLAIFDMFEGPAKPAPQLRRSLGETIRQLSREKPGLLSSAPEQVHSATGFLTSYCKRKSLN